MSDEPIKETMTADLAEYQARCYVNGMRRHGRSGKMEPACGEFSMRHVDHPWVRESVLEGWGRELRSHLILAVKLRRMRGEPLPTKVDDVMPPREWVDAAKYQAARYAAARDWQRENRSESVGLSALLAKIRHTAGLSP
jgi:hypothetical protein